MSYFQNCGEKLPENALFYPKCGARTAEGVKAHVSEPSDEMREAIYRMSAKLEKASTVATEEVHEAIPICQK